jgi:hypothetical protein
LTILSFVFVCFSSCRKPYDLSVAGDVPGHLVVEGTILVGQNEENEFKLSRLTDLSSPISETAVTGARVEIVGSNGSKWLLPEVSPGTYRAGLSLSETLSYKLQVQTAGGSTYTSKETKVILTPPIDSLSWKYEDNNVTVYAHTHDPSNATRYYRWYFNETWETHAWYETYFDFVNGSIVARPPGDQIFACWKEASSNTIVVGNSTALTDDVISYQPITTIAKPSEKMFVRYSVLVRQIGLPREAYDFWTLLKKNTELTGTLFDPQPSILPTNILCISDPSKKAIGYVSAASVREKRLFIRNSQLSLWPYRNENTQCPAIETSRSAAEAFLAGNPGYLPAYYVTAGGNFGVAERKCVDCRLAGGTNIQPAYW